MAESTGTEAYARQIALEEEMLDRGKARFFRTNESAKARGSEATSSYGKTLLKHAIIPFAEGIKSFLQESSDGKVGRRHKASGLLQGMDAEVVAFIALRKALDSLTTPKPMQRIAVRIGREIEFEQRLEAMRSQDRASWGIAVHTVKTNKSRNSRKNIFEDVYKKKSTVDFEPWDTTTRFHVGQKLIEIMIAKVGLFNLVRMKSKKIALSGKARYVETYTLEPSAPCLAWIERHEEHASLMAPDFFPCLIPPRPWEGSSGGGYHSEYIPPLPLVKTRNKDYLEELDRLIRKGGMSTVTSAVAALQETAWQVNRRTEEVAQTLWDRGGGVAGIPPREAYRLPRCPVCGADITDSTTAHVKHPCFAQMPLPRLEAWKRDTAKIREKNIRIFGQRICAAKILSLAARFRPEERFFFPYQLDFRGRIYSVPPFLNPQGADLAKGLLHFAEGKPLGSPEAVRWLAVHVANSFGFDKATLEERHAWVVEHQERILEVDEDPFGQTWWQDADSPFCFLAACFEWAGYVREGLAFVSHIPIAMDGTCNGLQIFSLLLRDPVGGHAVNCTPTERPQDIYQIVADKVIGNLNVDIADKEKRKVVRTKDGNAFFTPAEAARGILKIGVTRKTTKRQVMVLPYGGTFESCIRYTEEWLEEAIAAQGKNPPRQLRGWSYYLASHIWNAIGDTVIAARDCMNFLQGMARVASERGHSLRWTTPAGLPVVQAYPCVRKRQVTTRLGDRIIKPSLPDYSPTLDKTHQILAISPNYVHSLDAAALMHTVIEARQQGIHSFAMIHDSYATFAADTAALAAAIRRVFVGLFGGDRHPLMSWREEVMNTMCSPDEPEPEIPPLPQRGTLNVAALQKAAFFFS